MITIVCKRCGEELKTHEVTKAIAFDAEHTCPPNFRGNHD